MKRLYVYCEGLTEESFVNTILAPWMQRMNVIVIPKICETKRTPVKAYKGGVSKYSRIKKDLQSLCGEHPNEMITTMLDLYGLPQDAPGIESKISDIYEKAKYIETEIMNDIGNRFSNLFFNLVLHEFEGLLFSDVSAFENITDNTGAITVLYEIRAVVPTPEHINDSPETAPSKRIKKLIPEYEKVSDGIDIAESIGIEKIINECRHFADWLAKLTAWAKEGV